VLSQYNVSKPLLMNEGGLLCVVNDNSSPYCINDDLFSSQANYVFRMYARTYADGIQGSAWYTLNGPGWRQGGLLDSKQNPRPAYTAMQFMISLLREAQYRGSLLTGTHEGYEFLDPIHGKLYQIYWSNDASTFSVDKTVNTIAVFDVYGNDITPAGDTIQIGFDPIIIELTP
jgi:hypothetical protein